MRRGCGFRSAWRSQARLSRRSRGSSLEQRLHRVPRPLPNNRPSHRRRLPVNGQVTRAVVAESRDRLRTPARGLSNRTIEGELTDMSIRSHLRRAFLSTGVLVVCITFAGAVAPGSSLAASGGINANCGLNDTMTCTGVVDAVPIGSATEDVAATCTATDEAEESTGVTCYLQSLTTGAVVASYGTLWLTGNTSVVGGAHFTLPVDRYQLCVEGGYTEFGGTQVPLQNPVCTTLVV
jgi:hypothetical protein